MSYDLALTPGPNIAVGDDWVVYASAPAEDRVLRLVTVLGEAPASGAAAAPSPAVERASASSSATPGVSSAVPTGGAETVGPGSTFPVPFTAALPSAIPMAGGYPGWWLQQETPGYASFQYVRGPDRTPAYVTVYLVAGVLKDPCHPEDGTVPMSEEPSIDELAEALTQQPGVRAGPMTDITVGDHAGRTFELTNSIDATQCTGDPWLPQWTYRSAGLGSDETANSEGLPNTHQRIAIVDVDGVTVLIESWELGAMRPEVLEANALFESIRFE